MKISRISPLSLPPDLHYVCSCITGMAFVDQIFARYITFIIHFIQHSRNRGKNTLMYKSLETHTQITTQRG